MRIHQEITSFLGRLLAPATTSPEGLSSRDGIRPTTPGDPSSNRGRSEPGTSPLLPADNTQGTDRVTLSAQATAFANTLVSGPSLRQDVPPVALPATRQLTTGSQFLTSETIDAERAVKALVPVVSNDQSLFRQQPSVTQQDRETPETRRLVRATYGFPQTDEPDQVTRSGTFIKIRV
jgi:hypothetical protein